MKGLKRKKRKFTRNIQAPSSTNQKNTNFDYGTFRQFNALLPNQRVDALITPGKKAWSPLSKVKRDRSILKASLAASASKRRLLAGKSHRDHAKIAKLKVLNNQLMVDLHRERRVSNKMIDEAMVEARRLSDEALEMMSKANEMRITERNRASSRIREERAHHSRQSERLGRKQATSIEKLHQEQGSLVNEVQSKFNMKLHKAREKVTMEAMKLKEQRSSWQKRLSEIDLSSKNKLSKERARRRDAVQQQLDRTSAMESQLQEIIEGLGIMNYELVDEVKNANSAKRTAIKLYDKSKEAATRRLGQLRQEKEQKNELKDELTRVLRTLEAQEAQLNAYKSMVETLKSSKRNLSREVTASRRGGARWPLWVTEVCCELLVDGSPPSAIPSSIGTLFASLYGEEPRKIPSLNYVRQCRVLVQTIGETITAMKLAACSNWAEIFLMPQHAVRYHSLPLSSV
jgi:FtsZ-binding cell division protein ZapB